MTPYSKFIDAFLDKIADYKFLNYTDDDLLLTSVKYMKSACLKFKHVCSVDLSRYDDSEMIFLDDGIDDEIVDIISEGMVAEWLKPYRNNSDNLENILNTKDFTMYSSANLLTQVKQLEEDTSKRFIQMMREYSFNHGDLTALHL